MASPTYIINGDSSTYSSVANHAEIYSYDASQNLNCEQSKTRAPKTSSRNAEKFLIALKKKILHVYGNRRQRIKPFKMVVDTSERNQYSYFNVLNPFLSLTRPWLSLTAYISDSIIDADMKFWQNFDYSLKIVLLKFEIDNFYSL